MLHQFLSIPVPVVHPVDLASVCVRHMVLTRQLQIFCTIGQLEKACAYNTNLGNAFSRGANPSAKPGDADYDGKQGLDFHR